MPEVKRELLDSICLLQQYKSNWIEKFNVERDKFSVIMAEVKRMWHLNKFMVKLDSIGLLQQYKSDWIEMFCVERDI